MLVTSRSPLRLRMEHEFTVTPLALPEEGEHAGAAKLFQYGSVALFVQRARAVKSDFQLTEDNAAAVAEVCRRVDGLPLAIELVAAHIRLLSPQAILARLGHPLRLLRGGPQDAPARHRSMRDSIELSYRMLDEPQQRLFRCMAVFVGGCSLQVAEAVCNAAGDISLEMDDPQAIEVLEGAEALVDRSLLKIEETRRSEQGEEDDPRLTMLETVREYALEQLAESGEVEAVKKRHAGYYLAMAERVQPDLNNGEVQAWMARLGPEHGNLRAALGWLLQLDEPAGREAALRLILNLEDLWGRYHNTGEVQRWLETALTGSDRRTTLLRVRALRYASRLSYLAADYSQAEEWAQQALAGARDLGDETLIAAGLNHIGLMAIFRGNYAQARTLLEEALALFRRVGDEIGVGAACINLGEISRYQGDYTQAESYYRESLSIFRASGRKLGVLQALSNIGHVVYMQGDLPAAKAIFVEALELSHELDARKIAAEVLTGVSSVILAEASMPGVAAARAAQILGITSGIIERSGRQMEPIDREEYDRNIATTRATLGEAAFDSAWEDGRTTTVEEAIELVTRPMDTEPDPHVKDHPEKRAPGGLTRREAEVTGLVACGLTNEVIAHQLVLSERTVEMHVSRALHKLGLTTRTQLTAWAIHNGLAPDNSE